MGRGGGGGGGSWEAAMEYGDISSASSLIGKMKYWLRLYSPLLART